MNNNSWVERARRGGGRGALGKRRGLPSRGGWARREYSAKDESDGSEDDSDDDESGEDEEEDEEEDEDEDMQVSGEEEHENEEALERSEGERRESTDY